MKCVACGNDTLVKGTLMETSGGGKTVFRLEEGSLWKDVFAGRTRNIRAYACPQCHHLQLAVEFTEQDLQQYRPAEG